MYFCQANTNVQDWNKYSYKEKQKQNPNNECDCFFRSTEGKQERDRIRNEIFMEVGTEKS